MILKIVTFENPIIRKKLKPVARLDRDVMKFVADMRQTVLAEKDPEGVGLAANQVGHDRRIFLAKIGQEFQPFINPEITHYSKDYFEEFEGCLSIPDLYGFVKRAKTVTVKYMGTDGKPKTQTFEGLPSRIMQHELDHLNGKLFIDHVKLQTKEIYHFTGTDDKGEPQFEKYRLE